MAMTTRARRLSRHRLTASTHSCPITDCAMKSLGRLLEGSLQDRCRQAGRTAEHRLTVLRPMGVPWPADVDAGDALRWPHAMLCARLLAKARWRARLGRFDARLVEWVYLASDLLDDLDEVLLTAHRSRDERYFAIAARLHRKLEQVQAAIPPAKRVRPQISGEPLTRRDGTSAIDRDTQ